MATVLALKGLSCGHCVANVTKTLEIMAGSTDVQLTKYFAKVIGEIDPQALIDAIIAKGYSAEIATPNLVLALNGLSCDHCIKNVSNALTAVENVDIVEVEKMRQKFMGTLKRKRSLRLFGL